MVAPPASGKQPATLYDEYGVAGDYWAATNLQCSDMTSLIGNNVAGMVFDAAKSIDRVTITVYQSAAGEGILSWLQRVTDKLITSLGNAIYFPYLAVVVILGAIWLAWQGLIRKRGTRTIEGTIWMVVACAAAHLPDRQARRRDRRSAAACPTASRRRSMSPSPSCRAPARAAAFRCRRAIRRFSPTTYSYTSGSTVVDQNADELWTVLVCKPWLVGEFGTSVYATGRRQGRRRSTPTGGRCCGRRPSPSTRSPRPRSSRPSRPRTRASPAASRPTIPSIYPLFQGKEWTTRLEVAFAALFAAVVAGVLVLLISVTLILLKLSFLLLLIVGPFFLLIGTHPGFGRVVALRWVEMLIGVLLKQAAVALVLSVLLYCYALIMGTSDAVLPWALKILMIALVTVAAFIYRKPFQHLFSAVGYGVIGSQDRAEADLARAGASGTRQLPAQPPRWRCRASPPTGRAGGRGAIPARRRAWRWPPRPAARRRRGRRAAGGRCRAGAAAEAPLAADGTAAAAGRCRRAARTARRRPDGARGRERGPGRRRRAGCRRLGRAAAAQPAVAQRRRARAPAAGTALAADAHAGGAAPAGAVRRTTARASAARPAAPAPARPARRLAGLGSAGRSAPATAGARRQRVAGPPAPQRPAPRRGSAPAGQPRSASLSSAQPSAGHGHHRASHRKAQAPERQRSQRQPSAGARHCGGRLRGPLVRRRHSSRVRRRGRLPGGGRRSQAPRVGSRPARIGPRRGQAMTGRVETGAAR